MAWVRNPNGEIGQVPDEAMQAAQKFGFTRLSDEEVAAERAKNARAKEAAQHPIQAFGENALESAVDTFTSPVHALGGAIEGVVGPNAVSEGLGYMSGKNALAALKDVSQGWGGNASDVDQATERYMQEQQARTEANPVASGVGSFGGSIVGMAPLAGIGGAAGKGTTSLLGGAESGLARAGGYLAEGATIGGISGLAAAEDEAHRQQSYLRGEQALVAGGLGALLGGVLNLGGRKFGELYKARKAGKAAAGLIPDLFGEEEGEGVRSLSDSARQGLVDKSEALESLSDQPRTLAQSELSDIVGSPSRKELQQRINAEVQKIEERLAKLPKDERPELTEEEIREAIKSGNMGLMPGEEGEHVNAFEPTQKVTLEQEETTNPGIKGAQGKKRGFVYSEAGNVATTEEAGAATAKELSSTDPAIGGMSDNGARRTQYNPEAKFVEEATARDFSYPGRYETTEEALNLAGKGPLDTTQEAQAALLGEDLHMRNRAAKVAKLLEQIPPGANGDWVLKMSQKERDAFVNYVEGDVGDEFLKAPKKRVSESTWRALADAVDQREGVPPEVDVSGKMPPVGTYNLQNPDTNPLGILTPEPTPPVPGQPGNFGQGGTPIGGLEPTPNPFEPQAFQQNTPFEPKIGGNANPDVIGVNPNTKPIPAVKNQTEFGAWVKRIARSVAGRRLGAAMGGAMGYGAGGPLGGAIGASLGYSIGSNATGYAFDKLASLASKGAGMAGVAIDGALSLGTKAPQALKLGVEADLARKYFYKGADTPEQAYMARMKELQALQADNSSLLIQKVSAAFGPLAQYEKGAVIATVQASQRAISYLLSIAPKATPDSNSLTPMANAVLPNRSDLNEFGRIYTTVMHPLSILVDIKNGTVTTGQIEAIRNVYPQWYQENIVIPYGDKLRARDMMRRPLLPSEREVADTVLGIYSGVESQSFVDNYADKFTQAIQAQNQPPQKKTPDRKSNIASVTQTQTSKMLGPIQ